MSEQPYMPEPCEHHWHSYLQPKSVGLRWIMQCSQCGDFNTQDLQEQIAQVRQEAKVQALRDAADELSTGKWGGIRSTNNKTNYPYAVVSTARWLNDRADQIEQEGDHA